MLLAERERRLNLCLKWESFAGDNVVTEFKVEKKRKID